VTLIVLSLLAGIVTAGTGLDRALVAACHALFRAAVSATKVLY
jgi:hypothetical protein